MDLFVPALQLIIDSPMTSWRLKWVRRYDDYTQAFIVVVFCISAGIQTNGLCVLRKERGAIARQNHCILFVLQLIMDCNDSVVNPPPICVTLKKKCVRRYDRYTQARILVVVRCFRAYTQTRSVCVVN